MCATVFYTKLIKGKLYPKAARTGPYAYANDVSRVRGRVVSKYVGIVTVPETATVVEKRDVVESGANSNVVERRGDADESNTVEREGESDADHAGEPQQV